MFGNVYIIKHFLLEFWICPWWTVFWRLDAANFVSTKERYAYLC